MARQLPRLFRDLLTKKAFANLATLMPDGSPQVTPVWYDYDGECIRINSARGRLKDRNIEHDRHVALAISDPDNPYQHVAIRGTVVEITQNDADRHIDELAKKYLGQDKYPFRQPGEVRVIYRIRPSHVAVMQ